MELSVATAFKQVGEAFPFSLSETFEPVIFGGRRIEFAAPVVVRGTYVFDGKAFAVEAEAETTLRSVCGRCAKRFDEPLCFQLEERFVKAAEASEDAETYSYTGNTLELTKAAMDNLFLALPLVSVCRPDCRGLCPVCGQDLNASMCHCQPTEAPGPFSALAALSDKE